MKKEIYTYLLLFLLLSLFMHLDQWFSSPFLHIANLENSGAYGFGVIHPFLFTFIIYLIVLIPRSIIKLFRRNSK